MAQDSQIYRFFADNPPSNQFLFKVRIIKNYRPKIGDSISDPVTGETFRVMRDEVATQEGAIRITHDGRARITHDNRLRLVGEFIPNEAATHNYFVQPANNPQRVSTWTTNTFDDDRTLDQLYNNKWS